MSQYVTKIRTDAGDLQIDYNALANQPTISNPNLLMNANFKYPINQRRGATYEGHTDRIYTIDRWCHNASDYGRILYVHDGYVKYENPNTTYNGFWFQQLENPLPSGNYTITVSVKSVTGNGVYVGNLISSSDGVTWGNVSTFKLQEGINTFTFNGDCAGVYFQASKSSSVELYWVKLEVGTAATQFCPRFTQEELLLCKRYYDVINGIRVLGAERDQAINSILFSVPRTAQMRAIPTLSINGNTTENSTSGICVRNTECGILEGYDFTYHVRSWEVIVLARCPINLDREAYQAQLYISDDFLICLDAEIY